MDSDNDDLIFGDLKDTNPYAQYGQPAHTHTGYPDREPDPSDPGHRPPTGTTPPPATPAGFFVNSICLLLITLVVGLVLYLQNFAESTGEGASPQGDLANLIVQGKFALGMKSFSEKSPEFKKQQEDQPTLPFGLIGSVRSRQAGAVMVAELESKADALDVLELLEDRAQEFGYEFNETEKSNTETLRKIFSQNGPLEISDEQEKLLKQELLWFGELALNPQIDKPGRRPDPARQKLLENSETVLITLVVVALAGIGSLLVGLVGGIVMLVMYSSEKLKIRTSRFTQQPTVYLEAFTVWICSFIGFSIVLGAAAPDMNPLVGNLLVFALSFGCGMIWPLLRGCGGAEMRKDIGFAGNPFSEAVIAVWCYICSLPLVLLGFFVTMTLLVNAPSTVENDLLATGPGHPLLEWVMQGDPSTIVLVFAVACIGAPVVEETFFRGFFYRALKDNSFRLGRFASMFFAALVNGLVFAAIHPQGIYFIPVLCSLGMAFSFAREWRGSLWTPMVMHAIHNGILTTILVVAIT